MAAAATPMAAAGRTGRTGRLRWAGEADRYREASVATWLARPAGPAAGAAAEGRPGTGAECRASEDRRAPWAVALLSSSGVAEPPVGGAGSSSLNGWMASA